MPLPPADAAPAPCAKQASAIAIAKKQLKKAKTTKARTAAKKRLSKARAAKKKCDAGLRGPSAPAPTTAPAPAPAPAPPVPAPAAAPAPAPAPAPQVPLSVTPGTIRITDAFTVTTAARAAAPAGYHYRIYVSQLRSSSSSTCARFVVRDLDGSGAAWSAAFTPRDASLPIGGSTIWCGGAWFASLALISDTAPSGDIGQLIENVDFTVSF
ncbi:hypothetical protein [Patulibacter sp. SYSU D01012]|uniref:hypothetical protein n=1 Tax=Patulibacter sp. SYSU D01012 TaxID=2817381 RepID=UPI001B300792|nr:hypothetical protein [Patulibacter sp. SYSU D01012]